MKAELEAYQAVLLCWILKLFDISANIMLITTRKNPFLILRNIRQFLYKTILYLIK